MQAQSGDREEEDCFTSFTFSRVFWAGRQPAGLLRRHCGTHGARPDGQRPQQRHDGLRSLWRRQNYTMEVRCPMTHDAMLGTLSRHAYACLSSTG